MPARVRKVTTWILQMELALGIDECIVSAARIAGVLSIELFVLLVCPQFVYGNLDVI